MENRTATVGRSLELKCLWIDKRKDEEGVEKTAVSSLAQHGTTRPAPQPHTVIRKDLYQPKSTTLLSWTAKNLRREEEQEAAATFHDCVTNPGFAHLICCCGWDPGNYRPKKKEEKNKEKSEALLRISTGPADPAKEG